MNDDDVPNQHEAVVPGAFGESDSIEVSLRDLRRLQEELERLREQVASLQRGQSEQLKIARSSAFAAASNLAREEATSFESSAAGAAAFLAECFDDLARRARE